MQKVTAGQVKAALAILKWKQEDLAQAAGLTQVRVSRQIARLEGGEITDLDRMLVAFEKAGIEFTEDGGVRPRKEGEHG